MSANRQRVRGPLTDTLISGSLLPDRIVGEVVSHLRLTTLVGRGLKQSGYRDPPRHPSGGLGADPGLITKAARLEAWDGKGSGGDCHWPARWGRGWSLRQRRSVADPAGCLIQGLLMGVCAAIGYGIGTSVGWLIRRIRKRSGGRLTIALASSWCSWSRSCLPWRGVPACDGRVRSQTSVGCLRRIDGGGRSRSARPPRCSWSCLPWAG